MTASRTTLITTLNYGGRGLDDLKLAQFSASVSAFFAKGAELPSLHSTSSLCHKDVPLPFSAGTILCDTSAASPRPYVPPSFCQIVFDSLHSLSHPGIRATQHLITKVNLAAQYFSSNVADAILYFIDELKPPQFQSCKATIKFILFDPLFDILNSRNPYGKGFNSPLHVGNKSSWFPYFNEAFVNILGLQEPKDIPICTTRHELAFPGFSLL